MENEATQEIMAIVPGGKTLDTRMLERCAKHPGAKAEENAQAKKSHRRLKVLASVARVLLCAVSGVFLYNNWAVLYMDSLAAIQTIGCVASVLIIADSVARVIPSDEEE